MGQVVRSTFANTMKELPGELEAMPLRGWNESVFRYFFCKHLPSDVNSLIECDRIDLVLERDDERAFVEFKFYVHAPKFDPYTGSARGFKGGPGGQNLGEFQKCVDVLHARKVVPGLSKYIVLVYVDPKVSKAPRTYAAHYDDYRHSKDEVVLDVLDSIEQSTSDDDVLRARLFSVT